MRDTKRQAALRWAMRLYGIALAAATATFYWLPMFGRWEPVNLALEHMFAAIFFAWGVVLFRGAQDPASNRGLIDFTALQGLLHGGIMAFDLITQSGHNPLHLLGDIPFHLSMAAVFGILRRDALVTPPIAFTRCQWVFTIFLFVGIGLFVFDAVFLRPIHLFMWHEANHAF